jgi:hypothetical protein
VAPVPDAEELLALEELAAAEEAEVERRKFADMIHGINAPIRQITALREAIRSPFDKITRLTDAMRSPVSNIARMQDSLARVAAPVQHLDNMRASLGAAAHLAEKINDSRVVESVRFAQQFLPLHPMPTNPMAKMGALLDRISPSEPLQVLRKLAAGEKVGSMLDPVAVEPCPESRTRPAAFDRKPILPPEVVEVEIQPRCKRCGSALKGELLMETKRWAGPRKVRGDLHTEVCEGCVRASGGDPERLPEAPKRPLD